MKIIKVVCNGMPRKYTLSDWNNHTLAQVKLITLYDMCMDYKRLNDTNTIKIKLDDSFNTTNNKGV